MVSTSNLLRERIEAVSGQRDGQSLVGFDELENAGSIAIAIAIAVAIAIAFAVARRPVLVLKLMRGQTNISGARERSTRA
jgi:hypothetical protein